MDAQRTRAMASAERLRSADDELLLARAAEAERSGDMSGAAEELLRRVARRPGVFGATYVGATL